MVANFFKRFKHLPAAASNVRRQDNWSMRRRLLWTVMATSLGLWIVSVAIVFAVAWFATGDMLDEALEEGTRLVLQLGSQEDVRQQAGANTGGADVSDALRLRMYYQLVAPDGRVILRGDDTPKHAFVPDFDKDKGDATVWVDGTLWRVHMRRGDAGISAQVAQPMEVRLDMLEDMVETLAWPALALLFLQGLATWWLIRRLMQPLETTARLIEQKSSADLARIDAPNPPKELQPILNALNQLLVRLDSALESERRFTSNAAHELRTPLAALRMRLQLLERQAALPQAPLQDLRADVDRCTALVESLLTLARLEPQANPLAKTQVDVAALIAGEATQITLAHGMHLESRLACPNVWAAPDLLAIAVRNMVDNAARYGRAGGRIRIETSRSEGVTTLAVRDDGPGVPPEQMQRLGERFFRVLGTGQKGSGLGLSIVARVAALHGASLAFEQGIDGAGLGVVMRFPS